jgi:xylan 1,4-beta-xylosidase
MRSLLSQAPYPRRHAATLALVLVAGCGGEEPRPPAQVTVTVHLGAPHRTASVSGFLHGLGERTPPDALVASLRPALWRSDLRRAPFGRVRRFGARYVLVLSDLWGYPNQGWGGRGPPWANLRRWERFVRRLARLLRPLPLIWDIWNEPNNPVFGPGGRRRFLRIYRVAYRTLREELGEQVLIGGPSISEFDRDWLEAFLDCCPADFVSWHENGAGEIPALAARVREARGLIARRPGAPRLVHVNETVGPEDRYRPGAVVGFLHALETGGADAAARACWPVAGGASECRPGALDGLLTPAGRRRAVWWAYRWYALGQDTRVRSVSSDVRVASLASAGPPARVLLGRTDRAAQGPLSVDVLIRGLELGQAGVVVERAPDRGPAPFERPARTELEELEVEDGVARVRVPRLRPYEAALVTVSRR